MRFLPVAALILLLFVSPELSSGAGLVPCSGTECTTCHVVQLANGIVKWLIGVLFVIFAIMIAAGGFGLVTSGGNEAAKGAAKSRITNAIIGIVLVLAAWLLVDTLMRGILAGSDGKIDGRFWYTIECTKQAKAVFPSGDGTTAETGTFGFQAFTYDDTNSCRVGHSGSYQTQAQCETAVSALKGSNPKFYLTKACDDQVVVVAEPSWSEDPLCATAGDPSADGSFDYQPGIAAQAGHMSAKLNNLLDCMADIVPGNVGQISSISDSKIINGSQTWATCRLSSRLCAHVPTSYHYGHGGACGDESYAVDFGDEGNAAVLCKAANACGKINTCAVDNGNHVHIDIPCP